VDGGGHPGRAVQVGRMRPTLKAPGTKRLKLKYDVPLSHFAFKFNLRRYILEYYWGEHIHLGYYTDEVRPAIVNVSWSGPFT